MTNRVVLDIDGMKVSMPGYNVLTAGDDKLLFNSEWKTLGIASKGLASTNGNKVRMNFGKTYPSLPKLFLIYRQSGNWHSFNYYSLGFTPLPWTPATTGPSFNIQPTYIEVASPSGMAIAWAYAITDATQ